MKADIVFSPVGFEGCPGAGPVLVRCWSGAGAAGLVGAGFLCCPSCQLTVRCIVGVLLVVGVMVCPGEVLACPVKFNPVFVPFGVPVNFRCGFGCCFVDCGDQAHDFLSGWFGWLVLPRWSGAAGLIAGKFYGEASQGVGGAVSDALAVLCCVVVHNLHPCPGCAHVLTPDPVCLLDPLPRLGAGWDVGECVKLERFGVFHNVKILRFGLVWFVVLVIVSHCKHCPDTGEQCNGENCREQCPGEAGRGCWFVCLSVLVVFHGLLSGVARVAPGWFIGCLVLVFKGLPCWALMLPDRCIMALLYEQKACFLYLSEKITPKL